MRKFVLSLVLVSSIGCGSMINLIAPKSRTKIYGGTQVACVQTEKCFVWVLDIPLSLVMDTATLPIILAKVLS